MPFQALGLVPTLAHARQAEAEAEAKAEFQRLAAEAAKEPQPELHIRGDKAVRYERVAQAMALAQQAGVRKIGFITEPAR
eukprot:gene16361-34190_t